MNISLVNMILIMHKNNNNNNNNNKKKSCTENCTALSAAQELECKNKKHESHLKIWRNILEDLEACRDAEGSV